MNPLKIAHKKVSKNEEALALSVILREKWERRDRQKAIDNFYNKLPYENKPNVPADFSSDRQI